MRVQQINATPSDSEVLPEVVFMAQGKRVEVSAAERTEIWRRWKSGESLREIGRAFGRKHTPIQLLSSHHGGIVPAVRRRSLQALTLAEREDISRGDSLEEGVHSVYR